MKCRIEKTDLTEKNFYSRLELQELALPSSLMGVRKNLNQRMRTYRLKVEKNILKCRNRFLERQVLKIPILSHGIMYNLIEKQIVIYNALKWGIDMIDTSFGYAGGNSELGIGKYLSKHPERRKEMFIVSKASGAKSVAEVEERLQTSLKRMKTDYVDLYYGVHGLSDPARLTPGLRKWAEKAKKRGVIKHFGFSTHKNMAKCLMAASKLDWIDALMTSWNFRLMQDKAMVEAVEACNKANIGLIAMKVMGLKVETEGDRKLVNHFINKGYTDGQAKLKVVLDDKRFASACVTMGSTALITMNAAVATDSAKLSRDDVKFLQEYALESRHCYCAGCADICDAAHPEIAHISDIMRYLMYYNNYGEETLAKKLYSGIPARARRRLAGMDLSGVEAVCPQKLPVGALIAEASRKLS